MTRYSKNTRHQFCAQEIMGARSPAKPAFWLLLLPAVLGLASAQDYTFTSAKNDTGKPTPYVVHMATWEKPSVYPTTEAWYEALAGGKDKLMYRYKRVSKGFSAKLTPAEADALQKKPGVLRLHPQLVYDLHTTRSHGFLGLAIPNGAWSKSNYGRGVIVGVIDTGVWPESPSFNDSSMDPPPARWKGKCERGEGEDFKCNNKIIGARYYHIGVEKDEDLEGTVNSPRDTEGHGTHTASTVAGAPVPNANFFGFGNGTACGMAPRAWIAVYKACWKGHCHGADILAAIDAAVGDGVDIINLSLGGGATDYFAEAVGSSSFGAVSRGVMVVASAGNKGPKPATVVNVAPWLTTVAASSVDRDFPTAVMLANGKMFSGASLYAGKSEITAPVIYNASIAGASADKCEDGTLDPELVYGKFVICDRGGSSARAAKGEAVMKAGGVGMILVNSDESANDISADSHVIPAINMGYAQGIALKSYVEENGQRAIMTLEPSRTRIGIRPAPRMAIFSSRGPNIVNPEILKPDICAPGVNILAAWPNGTAPSKAESDNRQVAFNFMSGTSMSCPHVAGIATLIRAARPSWSPAAIRSAMMTTAATHNNNKQLISDMATNRASSPFSRGAGHVVPRRALNPGLIYDITPEDYRAFICSLNYTEAQVRTIVRWSYKCTNTLEQIGDLNLPSFSAVFTPSRRVVKYRRVVTNVGDANSEYKVRVWAPSSVSVSVSPTVLRFARIGDKQSYSVTLNALSDDDFDSFGKLAWINDKVTVQSPLVFTSFSSEYALNSHHEGGD